MPIIGPNGPMDPGAMTAGDMAGMTPDAFAGTTAGDMAAMPPAAMSGMAELYGAGRAGLRVRSVPGQLRVSRSSRPRRRRSPRHPASPPPRSPAPRPPRRQGRCQRNGCA